MKSQEQPAAGGRDRRVATPGEVRETLEALTGDDHKKLMMIAKRFAWLRRAKSLGGPLEAEDLLQSAFVKTIEGERKWNTQVSFVRHLDRVMESLSGHAVERSKRRNLQALPEDARERYADPQPDAAERVATASELSALLALFENDTVALDVLRLKGKGHTASEIRLMLGLDEKNFASVKKRIYRLYARHMASGKSQR